MHIYAYNSNFGVILKKLRWKERILICKKAETEIENRTKQIEKVL